MLRADMADIYDRMTKSELLAELRKAVGGGGQSLLVRHEAEVFREETRLQHEQLIETQRLLEESRDRYADLYDFAPVPYVTMTGSGIVEDCNLTATEMLGAERLRVIGMPLARFVAAEDRKILLDHMLLCRRAIQYPVVCSLRIRSRDGSITPAELSTRRAAGQSGGAVFRTAIVDLSERVAAESARNQLLQRIMNAQEEERLRISRELHDQMGQYLAALGLGLKSLEDLVQEPAASRAVKSLQEIAGQLSREAHHIALELRPTALDDVGLASALQTYVEQWSERHGIEVDFHDVASSRRRFPSHIETTVYRVVQEALTNVLKHAHARKVSVILNSSEDGLQVVVEDDGWGFDAKSPTSNGSGGLGLLGARERIALVNGSLQIESKQGRGTTLFVRISLQESSEEVQRV